MSLNHVHITAGCKNDRSYLKHCYYKQPFKVVNITEDKTGDLLRLMLTTSSPGILSNDCYEIEIEVGEITKVHLTTQGYQRLFTMTGKANQVLNVHIKNNGSFCFLPHPSVPHKASNFSSLNNIYLNKNHNLVWSEIITCGRKLAGEEFTFTKFKNITNVYLNNRLVVKENVLLEPTKRDLLALGQLEGYTHQSTLLFVNDAADMQEISSVSKGFLSRIEEITFGISMLPVNGLIFRILAQKAEKLFDCNSKLATLIQRIVCLIK